MIKTWSEEGELRGQRKILLKQLQEQHPDLSEEAKRRLEQWPAERLEDLALGVLAHKSLRELGLAD
jgi:hypothetical protein